MSEKEYSVSEAVRLVGVESHVLRYWEEELQVEIRRTSQGHRVYSENNIETFRKVRELKERGLQLKAIRVLLDDSEGKASLTEQIYEIGNKQGKAEADTAQCGIYHAEEAAETTDEIKNAGEPSEAYAVCQPYETVLAEIDENNPDHLKQFEEILKSLIREVIEDQNKKQEQQLREILREEIRQMRFSYEEILQDMMQEAAAAQEPPTEKKGILQSFLRRVHPGKR